MLTKFQCFTVNASYQQVYMMLVLLLGIMIGFKQSQYTGSEDTGFIVVSLKAMGGTFPSPFSVTVTPSEESPVSAEGNNVILLFNVD